MGSTPNQRPDPDALLARVKKEQARKRRGRLKIFFGMAAGVGKTFAMLETARLARQEGLDVVAGIVETHRRAETEALLEGLEVLPRRKVDYRGATLWEFDLDAALARRPALILVDELAHTNAPGSRHPKRYQDVEELLQAGIDVYSTMNVQHIESLNDVVAQITSVKVQETVPDSIIEEADEVELIDLPPDELLQRLKEGKVYVPDQARHAIQNFFRKGNLIALRELALRRTADRVDAEMRDYRERYAIGETWPVRERILVGIGPGPIAEKLVRAGKRMARSLQAEWLVAYVETPKLLRLPEADRDRVLRSLQLAAQLGAETITLGGGQSFSEELLSLAHSRNVSKIVVGKPSRTGWRRALFGSVVDALIDHAGDIDVYVLSGEAEMAELVRSNPVLARSRAYLMPASESREKVWQRLRYVWAGVVMMLCTFFGWLAFGRLHDPNIIMLYLLGIVVVAVLHGRGPSILASVLGVAAFDFFFVPPYLTFAVADTEYLVTFAVMLAVALVISNLTAGIRLQARVAAHRERRTGALYAMTRELATTRSLENVAVVGVRHLSEVFECQAVILLPDGQGRIAHPRGKPLRGSLRGADLAVAEWVHEHGAMAGPGTDTLPGADALYLPLSTPSGSVGVLAVLPADLRGLLSPEQRHLLETFAGQLALAIERVKAAEEAQAVQLKMERERLRNTLLSGISHDLRTPLAVIAGSASSLTEGENLDEVARKELGQTIFDEAQRVSRLITNVLDMTRLESGEVSLNKQWIPLEEVVGSVLTRFQDRLEGHSVQVQLSSELPLVPMDGVLIEQVLANLLDNAINYTPPGTTIEISGTAGPDAVTVIVADEGPGLPPGDEERVFEKFYRARRERTQTGMGLGLPICRAIIDAHGGRIWAENRPSGGAVFRFELPITSTPPTVDAETET